MNNKNIEISGARTHNLKNINVNIPRNKLVVVTGKSGSGKSSLIIDTLFGYSKKIYLEALSSKNFGLGENVEYDIDYIKNTQPPVALEQTRKTFSNPRSTVSTLTGIEGFVKILFAKGAHPICPVCQKETNKDFYCVDCGCFSEPLRPQNFSSTSKEGMCLNCGGIGTILKFAEEKIIPDKNKTLRQIWDDAKKNTFNIPSNRNVFEKLIEHYGITWETPYKDLSDDFRKKVLYGSDEKFVIKLQKVTNEVNHLGIISYMDAQYRKTVSIDRRNDLEVYIDNSVCEECGGRRLRKESLSVKLMGKNFADLQSMSLLDLREYLKKSLPGIKKYNLVKDTVDELDKRLENICKMSVGYISLNRLVKTLSGGELQRLLISQHISSDLTGIMYVLDEPTIGLHDKDTQKIINMLKMLRDMGNSVIIIEHDEQVIKEADYIIELGPGAGKYGGEICACGSIKELYNNNDSITAQYMKNRKKVRTIKETSNSEYITFQNISKNNLKNITVKMPLNRLISITGVSGSGKSSLVESIYGELRNKIRENNSIKNNRNSLYCEKLSSIVYVDQKPITGSARSNIMTYIGFLDDIRDIFARQADAENSGLDKGHFSVNLPGGRCETCKGQGEIEVDMYFLKNEYVICDDCKGRRFREEVLRVKCNGKSIADIFDMSIEDALIYFKDKGNKNIITALEHLSSFGLGYLKLGQSTASLSGGEAQRINLITELMKSKSKNTLFIFDEPSTGLHFSDIIYLIRLFNELIDNGNSVLVIEHNLDIIGHSDYIIDIGPGAGKEGGEIIFEGILPEFLLSSGYTAESLRKHNSEFYSECVLINN